MFWDEANITIEAGRGGDGKVSFRHEKFRPRGGPNGGDGGNGGSVFFEIDPNLNTLSDFNRLKKFKAKDGNPGEKEKRKGKAGEDSILKVPKGTVVFEILGEKRKKIIDLSQKSLQILIAGGGRGGWGNWHFATATHQAPTRANSGLPGGKKKILLVLKLIAQVGIIGLPNSGKSTLLARISRAQPKIANYPFTTTVPNLGVVYVPKTRFSFVACDIPGLIEGASQGRGLGDKFLRHIERTKIIVHLIEAGNKDYAQAYKAIREELRVYNSRLMRKSEIVAISKVDIGPRRKIDLEIKKLKKKVSPLSPILKISAVTGEGIEKLLFEIKNKLKK